MIPVFSHDHCALLHGDCRRIGDLLPPESIDAIVTDPPYETGFMSKKWDKSGVAYDVGVWRVMLSLLKPGGHLLAFGGTRTYHRMACAIEDAGFEIRDSILHVHGVGFPKSLNVGKAIDTHLGAEREVVGDNPNHRAVSGVQYAGIYAGGNTGAAKITAPATPEAVKWDGWGSALKPAHEPIVLARRPLEGTIAANVLAHGVGGLNVDGCRIETEEKLTRTESASGRWPANIMLSHAPECVNLDSAVACVPWCPVRQLDAQSGYKKSRSGKPRSSKESGEGWGMRFTGAEYSDIGGASRFFYCPKPNRKERDLGLEHLTSRTGGQLTDRKDGSKGLENPRAGAGRCGGGRNFHPTTKPVDLMRWLCRLVTPPGGVVLDPFVGSGTTGVAALAEGFEFVGVDESNEYLELAIGRINHALCGSRSGSRKHELSI